MPWYELYNPQVARLDGHNQFAGCRQDLFGCIDVYSGCILSCMPQGNRCVAWRLASYQVEQEWTNVVMNGFVSVPRNETSSRSCLVDCGAVFS